MSICKGYYCAVPKEGFHTESDLRLLDDYRWSFGEAYEAVVRTIRRGGEFPTGRLAKSTLSIVEKLRRESIRLSQMQDIAGCRVVVTNVVQQDRFVATLKTEFSGASVIDRRDKPSYGYRAVHVIAEISGKPIEIQVRSSLQHLWAELSEKSSDVLDPTIKYGGGPDRWRNILIASSKAVAAYEKFEKSHFNQMESLERLVESHEKLKGFIAKAFERPLADQKEQELRGMLENSTCEVKRLKRDSEESREDVVRSWNTLADILQVEISRLDALERKKQ